MQTLPNDNEIKSYNHVKVYSAEPYNEYILSGKPIHAKAVIATREIVVETEQGFYAFNMDNVLSVQFEK